MRRRAESGPSRGTRPFQLPMTGNDVYAEAIPHIDDIRMRAGIPGGMPRRTKDDQPARPPLIMRPAAQGPADTKGPDAKGHVARPGHVQTRRRERHGPDLNH